MIWAVSTITKPLSRFIAHVEIALMASSPIGQSVHKRRYHETNARRFEHSVRTALGQ